MPMSCLSNTDTIIVWAINGTPPYTYNLQPNNLSNNIGIFPNSGIGVYTVSVIDASGCTASLVLALNPPPGLLWAGFQVTNVPCNGVGTGSLQCSAISGTPIYTYQIAPSNSTNTTGTFSNLPPNTYTVTVTDVIGCTNSSVTTISILPPITFNLPTKTIVKCKGGTNGSISVTTIGGTGTKNYTLTPGAVSNITGNFTNLTANTYTIKVTDASGCSNTTSVTISEPPILAIANITSTPPNCAPTGNGSISINATGGILPYEYKLNAGFYQLDSTISNLSIGNYTITVKDSNGCTQSSIYNLNNLLAPIITSLNINQANCTGNNNGIITTILTGGVAPINYTINPTAVSNSTGIFTGLPVNTYTVMVTDAVGCTTSFAAIIQEPSAITWNTQTITPVTCNGLANGQQIQLQNIGHNLKDGKTDVIIVIHEKDHSQFKRDGNNLVMDIELKLYQALFGFDKLIKHLDGRQLHISHTGVTNYGTKRKIHNEGMNDLRSGGKGDLVINFTFKLPIINKADIIQNLQYNLKTINQEESNKEVEIRVNNSKYIKTIMTDYKEEQSNRRSRESFAQGPQVNVEGQQHCVHQ
jgi:hypothetical protein